MITKELLNEILDLRLSDYFCDGVETKCNIWVDNTGKTKYICWSGIPDGEIDVVTFAHMCKEKVYKKGYTILSCCQGSDSYAIVEKLEQSDDFESYKCTADTEAEAVIKATEWVYNHKGIK